MPGLVPPELIIFDLDGTLVDSLLDITASVNFARSHFGLPHLEPDRVRGLVGDGVRVLIERAFATRDPNVVEQALRVYTPHYAEHLLDHTRPYPDVAATLPLLSGCTLAVLTNKPEEFARRILSGLQLASWFGPIVGGDSGPARKPDPAGVRAILSRTGVSADRALMVGDSLNDHRAARGAGIRSALALYGMSREEDLCAAAPDLALRRFGELPARLGLMAGPCR